MASSFALRLLRRFAGKSAAVEILPPARTETRVEQDRDISVEERADAFASLFLNAVPKDLRTSRMVRER